MSAIAEYDEEAMMQETIHCTHADWEALYRKSSSGQKSRMTQIENYYVRYSEADLKAPIIKLATHEYAFERLRKENPQLYRQVEELLSSYIS